MKLNLLNNDEMQEIKKINEFQCDLEFALQDFKHEFTENECSKRRIE